MSEYIHVMQQDNEQITFREHWTVKCTALILVTLLLSLSRARVSVFNWWNVTILWVAAYVVITKAWNQRSKSVNSDLTGLNEPFREHWTVKCTALILFSVSLSLSLAPIRVFNWWNVVILWLTAYAVITKAWNPISNPVNSDITNFREHWTVKTASLINFAFLMITATATRKTSSLWTTVLLVFVACLIIVIVWNPKKRSGPVESRIPLSNDKEKEK